MIKRVLLLILVFGVLFSIFSPLSLTFADNVSLMVPGKIYTAHWLKEGIIPLWNPTLFGGLPWLADINQSVLYPTTLFFVLLKPAAALNLTILSHVIISAWGMYVLAQLWFSKAKNKTQLGLLTAALWIFSAQFINAFNNITFLQSLAWMPWFVFFGIKIRDQQKYAVGISAIVLLQLLGGYPVHVLYSGITAVVFSAYFSFSTAKKRTKKSFLTWATTWALTTIASIGLSAVVWLPFLDVLSHSTRTLQTDAQAVSGSLHPTEYIKLLIPYFFDNPKLGLRWGPGWNKFPNVSFYIPWITFLLGGIVVLQKKITSRILLLAGLTIVPLIFALGEYLPGYDVIRQIPLFSLTRGPSLVLVVSAFSLALLIPELLATIRFNQRSKIPFTIFTVLSAIATTVSAVAYGYSKFSFITVWHLLNTFSNNAFTNSAFHTFERDQLIFTSITENILVSSISLLLAVLALTKLKKNLKWAVLIVIFSLEVLYGSKAMLWFGPASIYNQESQLVANLPQDAQSRYLIRNYNAPYTEYGSYWEAVYVRKPFSDSYVTQQELSEFKHLQRMVDGLTPNMHMSYGFNSLNAYTTLLPIDVDERWNTSDDVGINNVPEISATSSALNAWAVKYYLVDRFYPTTEDFSAHTMVYEQDLWRLYERLDALPRFRYEDGTPLEGEIRETPNQIILEPTNIASHSAVIIADRYDPNWQATVNGYPIPIEDYNGMRKIELPMDTREMVLSYQPTPAYQGAALSILTLLLVVAGYCVSKSKHPPS